MPVPKKNFAVSSVSKLLGLTKDYLLQIDFVESQVIFHKMDRGKQKKKQFSVHSCVKLLRSESHDTELEFMFRDASSPNSSYQKAVWFQTPQDRDLFCNLVHALIQVGPQAYEAFTQLDTSNRGIISADVVDVAMEHIRGRSASEVSKTPNLLAVMEKVREGDANATEDADGDDTAKKPEAAPIESTAKAYTYPQFLLAYSEVNRVRRSSASESVIETKYSEPQIFSRAARLSTDNEFWEPTATEAPATESLRRQSQILIQEVGPASSADLYPDVARLRGEDVLVMQKNASRLGKANSRGTLFLTNYRLIYRDYLTNTDVDDSIEIPYGCISRIDYVKNTNTVELHLKNFRHVQFSLDANEAKIKAFVFLVEAKGFTNDQTKLFAFSHSHLVEPKYDGWNVYDAVSEYRRVGLASMKEYRLVTSNITFELSPTYPPMFVVPAATTDEDLQQIAKFRSRGRLMAVTWVYGKTKAALARCSQPLSGLKGRRCEPDEKMFQHLLQANPTNQDVLHIIDARPYKAALGNTLMGKGSENMDNYDRCKLEFMGIDNIHAIRNSLSSLTDLCSTDPASFDGNSWLSRLESTQWLYYVRVLLQASVRMCRAMADDGASVVVHCSDGWDRTSQLASLTQILLDPFFRTLRGFAVVIEKEWLSFGHKFAERCGHGDPNYSHDQRAPIFLHFIDAVWQITRQFPCAFEFNEQFLLDIMDHVYSCRFGTFMFNSAAQRHRAQLQKRTVSLWTHMLDDTVVLKYINPLYNPTLDDKNLGRLHISCDARDIVLWEGYHLRPNHSKTGSHRDGLLEHTQQLALRFFRLKQLAKDQGMNLDDDIEDEFPTPRIVDSVNVESEFLQSYWKKEILHKRVRLSKRHRKHPSIASSILSVPQARVNREYSAASLFSDTSAPIMEQDRNQLDPGEDSNDATTFSEANIPSMPAPKHVYQTGYLEKQSGAVKGFRQWKRRWFIWDEDGIRYYKTEDDFNSNKKPLGCFSGAHDLQVYEYEAVHSDQIRFKIQTTEKEMKVRTTQEVKDRWLESMQHYKPSAQPAFTHDFIDDEDISMSVSANSRPRLEFSDEDSDGMTPDGKKTELDKVAEEDGEAEAEAQPVFQLKVTKAEEVDKPEAEAIDDDDQVPKGPLPPLPDRASLTRAREDGRNRSITLTGSPLPDPRVSTSVAPPPPPYPPPPADQPPKANRTASLPVGSSYRGSESAPPPPPQNES